MALVVYEQDVTDEPVELNLGPVYNNIDAVLHIPAGADSVWTGGPDVNTTDNGVERVPEGEYQISALSGTKIWAVADTGNTVTVKIEVHI